jgi:hypothetical protein
VQLGDPKNQRKTQPCSIGWLPAFRASKESVECALSTLATKTGTVIQYPH